ncbi:unnamed protein product [Linum tenue]|uniref:Uncharacterized protein n=1 Tax=Linum tenue TaxID=586396 RepID=A0AAV0HW45_9ROSI|nr:unnamed protein product [Linum tenue]
MHSPGRFRRHSLNLSRSRVWISVITI